MGLSLIDVLIIIAFFTLVVGLGMFKSRKEAQTSEDYFLASRGLKWWLIGFSLIAANISAEQFIGMSGQAAKDSIGLAVASYEWIAAITLVFVAFFFIPKFLKSGIFTIPEFLEYRFNHTSRLIMSLLMVVIYAGVTIPCVIFLGAKALEPLFSQSLFGLPINIVTLSWIVGIFAAAYVVAGGLKACAWADLIQGSALIIGGAVIMVLTFMALDNPDNFAGTSSAAVNSSLGIENGASLFEKLSILKQEKMHMVLPKTSSFLPWTALLIGIWIPNIYYWGLNQYIMQRTLGAHSLKEGQRGAVFAAFLKLIIPFIVCIPGIIAFTLYSGKMQENAMNLQTLNKPVIESFEKVKDSPSQAGMLIPFDNDFANLHPELAGEIVSFNSAVLGRTVQTEDLINANNELLGGIDKKNTNIKIQQELVGYDYDGAFPMLIRYLTPTGLRGFVLAALMGAVISSLASMLNAASTIFTMDIYREWFNKHASQKTLVVLGRFSIPILVIIGCVISPILADPKFKGAFAFIQEFQGFISPGILTIFLFGLFVKKAPRICGVVGLISSPIIYGILFFGWGNMAFLNRMAITVGVISAILILVTIIFPLKEKITLPDQSKIEMHWSKGSIYFGIFVVILTILLYIIFW
jgi:SSS family solute:Na+ symporter